MNSLKAIVRSNRLFFILTLLISFVALLFNDILYIPLSAAHPAWLNVFFINYSFMGDGLFAISLAVFYFLYLKKKETGMILFFSFLTCEGLVQLIKNLFSRGASRIFFEKGQYLFFTDESELVNLHSFPSGHTALAFAIATVLMLVIKNKHWQLPVLLAAFLLGISRMYLAQNSIAEVIVGIFIGAVSGLLVFCMVKNAGTLRRLFSRWSIFGNIQQHSTFTS